jgi:hypothetical protein
MSIKPFFFPIPGARRTLSAVVLAAAALVSASCTSSNPPAASSAAPTPSSPSPSPSVSEITEVLTKAQAAASGLKKYSFDLDLSQKLTGESPDSNSTVSVNMQGRAELGPLKLDQLVKSTEDGEVYSMRAIVVPEGYYMYDNDFEEWSKTPPQQAADMVKTFSDFQVNPAKAIADVRSLGGGLQMTKQDARTVVRYTGNGAEAQAFLNNVLESTLGLSEMAPSVRKSIRLGTLKVELVLDNAKNWPLSYRIESGMTVEYEAGKLSTLAQTMSGNYSHHNASDPVVVPEAAKNAPELDPSVDDPAATATTTLLSIRASGRSGTLPL